MDGFTTKAIHGVTIKKDVHGTLRMPVYDSVAFEYETSRDIQLAFEGKKPAHAYSRISNPTVEDFEQKIRLLSDSLGVIAVSSGMAAISNLILTLAGSGTNIVTSKHIFGNTLSLFESTLKPWGLNIKYVDMTNLNEVENAVDENTRLIYIENVTNPQLEICEVKKISQIANKHNIPLVADCTLTTPYIFKSKNFGIDVEILSSTKYISGGASTVGGLIIDNGTFSWGKTPKLLDMSKKVGQFALIATLRREVYRNVGACLSPHNAYMQSLGLETLSLRIEKSSKNSMAIAEFLDQHKSIKQVNYPGLVNSQFHETAKKQFAPNYGGILTFDLPDQETCFKFMDRLTIIRRATNINDNKTLVIHPYSTIFSEYSHEKRLDLGVRDTMIRLAVGIEDIEDLMNDLNRGLETL